VNDSNEGDNIVTSFIGLSNHNVSHVPRSTEINYGRKQSSEVTIYQKILQTDRQTL